MQHVGLCALIGIGFGAGFVADRGRR